MRAAHAPPGLRGICQSKLARRKAPHALSNGGTDHPHDTPQKGRHVTPTVSHARAQGLSKFDTLLPPANQRAGQYHQRRAQTVFPGLLKTSARQHSPVNPHIAQIHSPRRISPQNIPSTNARIKTPTLPATKKSCNIRTSRILRWIRPVQPFAIKY